MGNFFGKNPDSAILLEQVGRSRLEKSGSGNIYIMEEVTAWKGVAPKDIARKETFY